MKELQKTLIAVIKKELAKKEKNLELLNMLNHLLSTVSGYIINDPMNSKRVVIKRAPKKRQTK
jgi:hypothetical protein